ncbi:DEAD/DEAH box helicase [Luteococcus sediminum]
MPHDVPEWLSQFDDPTLRRWFDVPTVERGADYARRGRVLAVEVLDGDVIRGQVAGSASQLYRVVIRPVGASARNAVRAGISLAPHMLSCLCSCPVGEDCKHCVAVLVELRNRARQHPTGAWRAQLQEMAGAVDSPTQTGREPMAIEYRRVGPDVEFKPMRLGKRGNWVKGNLRWDTLRYESTFLRSHLDVMQALADCGDRARSTSYSYYGYRRPTALTLSQLDHEVWSLLDEAQDVGVELVPASGTHPMLFGGPVLDLVVGIDHPDGDTSRLQVAPVVLSGEQALNPTALLGHPAHGVVLEAPDGGALVAGFRHALTHQQHDIATAPPVEIPGDDLAEFALQYLPQLARRVEIRLAPDVELPTVEPPKLLVEVTAVASDSLHPVTARVTLGYRYGGRDAGPDVTARSGIGLAIRDREAEQGLWPLVHQVMAGVDVPSPPPTEVVLEGAPALRLLAQLEGFEDHDDVVIVHRGDLTRAREVTGTKLGLSVDPVEGRDWFDLAIDMSVDGVPVPLPLLLRALAAGHDHLLLDSGAWISLDQPELERLRELLQEAELVVDPDDETLVRARLHREHASWFEDLAELGVVRREAQAWQEAARRLRTGRAEAPAAPPALLRAELRPYQLDGMHWLDFLQDMGMGGILADDMGLGKTLQALAAIALADERGQPGPVLVVCPSSVVGGWLEQAERFVPHLRCVALPQTARKRGTSLAEAIGEARIVITSYAVARLDVEEFAGIDWHMVFLDEAQFVKNPKGQTYKAMRQIGCGSRFCLSGTPLENNLMDLWSLLSLSVPGLFPDPVAFRSDYAKPVEAGGEGAAETLARLLRRIKPVMLRRTKESVAPELPPKQEQVIEVELAPAHRRIYDRRLTMERKKVLGLLGDLQRHRVEVLAALTRLRQLSLAAGLVDPADESVASAKIDVLAEMMADVVAADHQALVFSSFPSFLRLVEQRFKTEGIRTTYLDGRTRKRQERIDEFRSGKASVFLISLKAGGFGLNLTEADYVFVTDPWWNPAAEAQAIDRAHRIGQANTVMVYRLASTDTIEAKVMQLQQHKRELFSQVVDGGESAITGALSADDFRALLE